MRSDLLFSPHFGGNSIVDRQGSQDFGSSRAGSTFGGGILSAVFFSRPNSC
jgi:hypothetical protein